MCRVSFGLAKGLQPPSAARLRGNHVPTKEYRSERRRTFHQAVLLLAERDELQVLLSTDEDETVGLLTTSDDERQYASDYDNAHCFDGFGDDEIVIEEFASRRIPVAMQSASRNNG